MTKDDKLTKMIRSFLDILVSRERDYMSGARLLAEMVKLDDKVFAKIREQADSHSQTVAASVLSDEVLKRMFRVGLGLTSPGNQSAIIPALAEDMSPAASFLIRMKAKDQLKWTQPKSIPVLKKRGDKTEVVRKSSFEMGRAECAQVFVETNNSVRVAGIDEQEKSIKKPSVVVEDLRVLKNSKFHQKCSECGHVNQGYDIDELKALVKRLEHMSRQAKQDVAAAG